MAEMTALSEKIVEAGARAAAREACSAADVDAWVDAHWPMYVGEVEAALRAALPMAVDALLKEAEGQSARFDFQAALAEYRDADFGFHSGRIAVVKSLRTRLSEIMDGLK